MDRLSVRAALLATVAMLLTACSTGPLDAIFLTGPAAEKTADADASASAGQQANPDGNLDHDIRQAQLLRSQGDLDGATHVLAQLMLVAPDDPRVVGEYGKVLAERGRSKEAVAFLNRAVQLQPSDWMLYSALGVAYDQMGDREQARAAYGNALRLDPNEASVLNNFALSRMLAGDLPMAASLSAQAAAKDPGNAKIVANRDMIAGLLQAQGGGMGRQSSASAPAPVAMKPASEPVAAKALPPPAQSSAASSVASGAPRALGNATVAKIDGQRVVMQKVPYDPDAGPVSTHREASRAPRRLAHDSAPEPKKAIAEKTKPAIPSLRTAAD